MAAAAIDATGHTAGKNKKKCGDYESAHGDFRSLEIAPSRAVVAAWKGQAGFAR
jgi:hypothetical protein